MTEAKSNETGRPKLVRSTLVLLRVALALALAALAGFCLAQFVGAVSTSRAEGESAHLALVLNIYPAVVTSLGLLTSAALLCILIGTSPYKQRAERISGPLQAERLPDGRRRLLRDLIIKVDGQEVVVPEGDETDFSTIPPFARFVLRWSRVDMAGVVHDRLYDTQEMMKSQADRVWRIVAMAGTHHANPLQAWLGYIGLLVGGWPAWWKHRRKDQKQ